MRARLCGMLKDKYLPQILIKKGIDALYIALRINVEGLRVLRAWNYPVLFGIARTVE